MSKLEADRRITPTSFVQKPTMGFQHGTMFLLQLIICNFYPAHATQANPQPFSVIQTGGKEVTLFLRGNEHFNYYTDTLGYPVVEQANAATTSDTLLSSIEAQPEYVWNSGRLWSVAADATQGWRRGSAPRTRPGHGRGAELQERASFGHCGE
jgi:hypothetical protein